MHTIFIISLSVILLKNSIWSDYVPISPCCVNNHLNHFQEFSSAILFVLFFKVADCWYIHKHLWFVSVDECPSTYSWIVTAQKKQLPCPGARQISWYPLLGTVPVLSTSSDIGFWMISVPFLVLFFLGDFLFFGSSLPIILNRSCFKICPSFGFFNS